jgi:hypothetical protein
MKGVKKWRKARACRDEDIRGTEDGVGLDYPNCGLGQSSNRATV